MFLIDSSTCPRCGKGFVPAPQHVYRIKGIPYCSYTCFIHEKESPRKKRVSSYIKKPVVVHTVGGEFVGEYENAKTASRAINVSASSIGDCLHGDRPSTKGYVITYKERII
jgi:hypothetical protein